MRRFRWPDLKTLQARSVDARQPEAGATLARIEPALLGATLELMAAHELAHFRRSVDGHWNALPLGFVDLEAETITSAWIRLALDRSLVSRGELLSAVYALWSQGAVLALEP